MPDECAIKHYILEHPVVLGLGDVMIKQLNHLDSPEKLFDLIIIDIENDRALLACFLGKTLGSSDWGRLYTDWMFLRENYEGREMPNIRIWKRPFEKGVCIIANGYEKQFFSWMRRMSITMPAVLLQLEEKESENGLTFVEVMNTT